MNCNRVFLFDFGTILVGLSKKRCIDALRQIGCGRIAYYVDECRQEDLFHELEIGGSIEAFCDEARRQSAYTDENGIYHPCTATNEEICWAWNQLLTGISAEKLRLIRRLKQERGVATAILSNTNQIHWQYALTKLFTIDGLEVGDYFDHVYLSCDMGMVKPDHSIYHEVVNHLRQDTHRQDLTASDILFIDDSAANCSSAEACGLLTLHDAHGDVWPRLFKGIGHYAAVIGNFDGVHQGHRHVLDMLKQTARKEGLQPLVITFDRHPRQLFDPAFHAEYITSVEEKMQLLRAEGVEVWMMSFTRHLADITARDFIHRILHDEMGVRTLLLGYDNRFGKRNDSETIDDYRRYGSEVGISVVQAECIDVDGVRVSSSAIRHMISQGQVEAAMHCMGRPFTLTGRVTEGRREGRKIGYPTANILLRQGKIMPKHGVYATTTVIDGRTYPSVTNIGVRPTYHNGDDVSIETHVIGLSDNIYGKEITVSFLSFLREEKAFDSPEALQRQIASDVEEANRIGI